MGVKRETLYFSAPRKVELREETLPALDADDVLVETICSAISAGTEMLIYQGRFPRDLETDPVISSLHGGFGYPMAYGYASVGVVREIGKLVDEDLVGRMVFSFQPHMSHYVCKPDALLPIPDTVSPQSACFLPNMETAVNLVQDGAPMLGERVLVFGQGIVGLLTASLLAEFPLDVLVTVDRFDLRCETSKVECQRSKVPQIETLNTSVAGFDKQAADILHRGADLTFELSGNPAALNDAIALTAYSGRIVIGSWYGEKPAEIDLGGSFHRSRIKMISSQVSTISPELSARWDKSRRFNVAWKALERIQPERWITHRFPIQDAAKAYQLLDENPQDALQVIFDYRL